MRRTCTYDAIATVQLSVLIPKHTDPAVSWRAAVQRGLYDKQCVVELEDRQQRLQKHEAFAAQRHPGSPQHMEVVYFTSSTFKAVCRRELQTAVQNNMQLIVSHGHAAATHAPQMATLLAASPRCPSMALYVAILRSAALCCAPLRFALLFMNE